MNKKNKQHFPSMNSIKETFSQQTLKSLLKNPLYRAKTILCKESEIVTISWHMQGKSIF